MQVGWGCNECRNGFPPTLYGVAGLAELLPSFKDVPRIVIKLFSVPQSGVRKARQVTTTLRLRKLSIGVYHIEACRIMGNA